jgi:3-methyladenine DNA glycosylase AlkD
VSLLLEIRGAMSAQADPGRAKAQQAYMKSTMPFHGVTMPEVRAISRRAFSGLDGLDCDRWRAEVLGIWRGAKFREERYAAVMLAGDRRYSACRTPEAMPMLEEMVVTGAWWDHVDAVAHVVGEIFRNHPKPMRRLMGAWSTDADVWKRRVSIICQVSLKKDTDLELLYANIEPNLGDRDFFIRKAIGWALRSYAWTDPCEVARYVRDNESRMSALSRREALKNVAPALR